MGISTNTNDPYSLPLPANAAQETGGNLAIVAANTTTLTALLQIYDQLVVTNGLLQLLVQNSVQGLAPGLGASDLSELSNPIN